MIHNENKSGCFCLKILFSIFCVLIVLYILFGLGPTLLVICINKYQKVECDVHFDEHQNVYVLKYEQAKFYSSNSKYQEIKTTSCYYKPKTKLYPDLIEVAFEPCLGGTIWTGSFAFVGVAILIGWGLIMLFPNSIGCKKIKPPDTYQIV